MQHAGLCFSHGAAGHVMLLGDCRACAACGVLPLQGLTRSGLCCRVWARPYLSEWGDVTLACDRRKSWQHPESLLGCWCMQPPKSTVSCDSENVVVMTDPDRLDGQTLVTECGMLT